jgi:hypothetical protein
VQQRLLNLALGHPGSIPARALAVPLTKLNQKYGQKALFNMHSTSHCVRGFKQF